MRRFLLCAVLAACCFCAGAAPSVHAGTSPSSDFQTINSPAGYSIQAPASWVQSTFPLLATGTDSEIVSSDRSEVAIVSIVEGMRSARLSDLMTGATQFIQKASQGISSGNSTVNIFQGPDSIQMPGAVAAVDAIGTYTDAAGSSQILATRLVLRGDSLYLFVLWTPASFYSSDVSFSAILDSFQLTPPTLSADLSTPARAFPLSPEEAEIAIRPYALGAQDILPGLTVGSQVNAGGASSDALGRVFPSQRFSAEQAAGLVVSQGQDLAPLEHSVPDPGASGRFVVELFAGADDAHAFATGQTLPLTGDQSYSLAPVALAAPLGDASSGWHTTRTVSGQPAEAYFDLRWQRGPLAFALVTPRLPAGQEQQSDAENLAQIIDAAEQTRPSLSIGSSTVTPPATEAQRLQAALNFKPFPLPDGATPAGFDAGTPSYVDGAGSVASAFDQESQLRLVDQTWKIVMSQRQEFTSQQGDGVYLVATATTCADSQGATAYASYASYGAGFNVTTLAAPVQIGDATYAHLVSGTDQSGTTGEQQDLFWTHGSVALSARMVGPSGSTSMDQVVALAKQVEASYPASQPAKVAPPPVQGGTPAVSGWLREPVAVTGPR